MKVFLSSTYEDLREHRNRAEEAIKRLGQQGVGMEVFGARPSDAAIASLDEVAACEAFIGIYAHRYGYVPSSSSISITESEFDFAQRRRKPSLCFLVDEDFPWSPKLIEDEPGRSSLIAFKKKVCTRLVCDRFTTPEDLGFKVASSLGRLLLEYRIREQLETIPATAQATTVQGRDQVSRRAARIHELIHGGRVLLVNDVPDEMRHVVSILLKLGVDIETVTSSEDAIQQLREGQYDVIISDMRRGLSADEGLKLLERIRHEKLHRPTIFTVGHYEPQRGTPPYAFGITNRVDELLNLTFDALERERG
jgi:CheY-like chemotaxis protein